MLLYCLFVYDLFGLCFVRELGFIVVDCMRMESDKFNSIIGYKIFLFDWVGLGYSGGN